MRTRLDAASAVKLKLVSTGRACLVPALMGLPVHFISDIPPEAVISVSIGIFWALVVAMLLLLPKRRT